MSFYQILQDALCVIGIGIQFEKEMIKINKIVHQIMFSNNMGFGAIWG